MSVRENMEALLEGLDIKTREVLLKKQLNRYVGKAGTRANREKVETLIRGMLPLASDEVVLQAVKDFPWAKTTGPKKRSWSN